MIPVEIVVVVCNKFSCQQTDSSFLSKGGGRFDPSFNFFGSREGEKRNNNHFVTRIFDLCCLFLGAKTVDL